MGELMTKDRVTGRFETSLFCDKVGIVSGESLIQNTSHN